MSALQNCFCLLKKMSRRGGFMGVSGCPDPTEKFCIGGHRKVLLQVATSAVLMSQTSHNLTFHAPPPFPSWSLEKLGPPLLTLPLVRTRWASNRLIWTRCSSVYNLKVRFPLFFQYRLHKYEKWHMTHRWDMILDTNMRHAYCHERIRWFWKFRQALLGLPNFLRKH